MNNRILRQCIAAIVLAVLSTSITELASAQIITVRGSITASSLAVRFASVTFIDQSDTTKRRTVLTDTSGMYSIDNLTSVTRTDPMPVASALQQNYPNPFSTTTSISYMLSAPASVRITVYDILGREIRTFSLGDQSAGTHSVLWDGRNDQGELVARGVYFCRMQSGHETQFRKMVFGFGATKVAASVIGLHPADVPSSVHQSNATTSGGVYLVRVANTDSTFPPIVAQQFGNVVAQSASSTDFSVSTNGTFPDATWGVIYPDNPHQVIRGFGAASPWYLPTMTLPEVDIAFGAGQGQLDFSILRLTIEPDSSQWAKYVSFAKRAQDLGAIVIASPWYAPSNMVETVNGNVSRVRYDKYADYAAHLNSYNAFMNRNGVSIYGTSLQNEPDITGQWTSWTSAEMLTFVKNNARAIKGTKIMAPESFQFNHAMTDPILNDSAASANTDIICGHIYGTGLTTYPAAASKGKEVWMTEHLIGENNSGDNWPWAMQLAKEMNDVMKADMSAYIWWTIVRYYGPIGDGQKATSPQDPNEKYPAKDQVTKKGYVMTQFARFVRPGFTRVWSTDYSPRSSVDVTAYRNGTRLVIVAINRNSTTTSQPFVIWNGTTGVFTPYVTSSSKNCEQQSDVSFKNGMFTYPLDASSVTTFVLK